MEFHPNDWLGRWQNFESYITSTDPYLQLAWQEAEAAAAALPMFKSGAKQFWQTACVTTSIGNPHTLGGWTITPADGGKLCIAWTDADVTQEVFVTAWKVRAKFDPAQGTLRSWLFGIALRVASDFRRWNRRKNQFDALPEDAAASGLSPDELASRREAAAARPKDESRP